MHKMGSPEPKHFIFGDHSLSKIARHLSFHVFLHFNARKHIISLFYLKWTEFTRIVNLFRFSSDHWAPTTEIKFPNSCEFGPLQVKWRCHMKKKKYMESELSGIFRVNVIARTILIGSLGTQRQEVFAMWCLFSRNIQIFRIKLLHLSVFLVKQYTSLIYVKQEAFCVVNWAYPLVGSRGPISCSKVTKIFHAFEV